VNLAVIVFFHLVPGGLEDLHLHRLPTEGTLQLPNPLLRRAQFARRHDVLVRGDCRLGASGNELLPALEQGAADPELPAHFRERGLPPQDPAHLLPLELGRVDPPAVRPPRHVLHRDTS
jgi:hypothetical protein